MEVLGLILLFFFGSVIWNLVIKGGSAAVSTATKGGTFADNFSNKLIAKVEEIKEKEFQGYGISIRGAPKITYSRDISVIVKMFDEVSDLPLLSTFEPFSEPSSRVFENIIPIGVMNEGTYWPDWARIAAFSDEMIIGPYKGRRTVEIRVYIWDSDNIPNFVHGYPETSTGAIQSIKHSFAYNFMHPGYFELDKERLRTQEISVQLAVGIALSDGSLDDKEGNLIKSWIKEIIETTIETEKEKVKQALNNSLEQGFTDSKSNKFDVDKLCEEVRQNSSVIDKYDLLELCLDVMAADGVADENELALIRDIAEKIDVDYDEVLKMKERRMVSLETPKSVDIDIERTLNDPNLSKEEKKEFITKEYSKWNNRLNSLNQGKERDYAQSMLDLLAEARKKYG